MILLWALVWLVVGYIVTVVVIKLDDSTWSGGAIMLWTIFWPVLLSLFVFAYADVLFDEDSKVSHRINRLFLNSK